MWDKRKYLFLLLSKIRVEYLLEFRRYLGNAKYLDPQNKSLGFFCSGLYSIVKSETYFKDFKSFVVDIVLVFFFTHQKPRFWMRSYSMSVLCLFLEDWEIQCLLSAEV